MFNGKRFLGFQIGLVLFAASLATTGCNEVDGFTQDQWAQIKKMEPLAGDRPHNPFNSRDDDDDLARFGQMLFFDKDVAEAIAVAGGPTGNMGDIRKVACVTCHDTKYFTDSRPFPISEGIRWLTTNTGAMLNLAWYDWTLSTGRFDGLVEHGTTVWSTSATPLAQARFMFLKYHAEYDAVFPDTPLDPRLGLATTDPNNVYPATGGPKSSATAADGPFEKMPPDAQDNINQFRANMGRVFDTYPRKLLTPESPFQKYVRDRDFSQLSLKAKAGLALFIGKAACNECHTGPTLTDNQFHNVGVPNLPTIPGSTTAIAPNRGRAGVMQAILNNLAALEANPDAVIFNGAGKYSDNRDLGMQRLLDVRQQDQDHCLTRDPMTMACTLYDQTLEGAFRTMSLLNVAKTGPYFHSGTVNTLEDVVRQYNAGGGPPGSFVGTVSPKIRPLLLTEDEISALVEFLGTLTGVTPADQAAADSTIWDWTKNTAKPPLPPPTGSAGASGTTGSAGAGGTTGSAGAGGTTGSAGAGGTTGTGGGNQDAAAGG
jgi:cytochrome c peroxidase